ncbi:hypothetical protein SAMN05216483_6662 [Streptomyces sp. 2131.1]|uniref:hypothetical protein n=1 Tax=Streptomyces sp. 2131.1 TaxID=1855346 RepID=UPI000894658A|nr:hypothetical protein [Streptomyces sp. 2131.1]SEE82372.1 hypothetical protein SAMN05216483_6662 [Streptomyces sp. 2131.1]
MPKAGKTYGPRIPAPNYAQIKKDSKDEVLKKLGLERPEDAVHVRPEDLIVKAAGIVAQADAEIALHLDERDQALAHLWFYEQRLGLAATVGLGNMGYRQALATVMFGNKKHVHELPTGNGEELIQAAEAAGIERVEGAEEKLLEAAPIVFAARARRDLAVRFMQEAVFALSEQPYGWKPEKIAEHADVERNLIYKQRAAARRRRGL